MTEVSARAIDRRIQGLDRRIRDLERVSRRVGADGETGHRIIEATGLNGFNEHEPERVDWSEAPFGYSSGGKILAGVEVDAGEMVRRHSSAARLPECIVPRGSNSYSVTASCLLRLSRFHAAAGERFEVFLQAVPILSDYDVATASWDNWCVTSIWTGLSEGQGGVAAFGGTDALTAGSVFTTAPKQFILGGRGYQPDLYWDGYNGWGYTFNVVVPIGRYVPHGLTIYGVAFILEYRMRSNVTGYVELRTDGNLSVIEADLNLHRVTWTY